MNKLIYILAAIFALSFQACDNIDEADRYIDFPVVSSKRVLLVDFTGQRCVNCPTAAELTHNLVSTIYGDSLVVVSMHAGNQSVKPLRTDMGDKYIEFYGVPNVFPTAVVDGGKPSSEYSSWPGLVSVRAAKMSPVNIALTSNFNSTTGDVNVEYTVTGVQDQDNLKVLLWALESGIQARQQMPDGGYNDKYIHNHIFRDAINSIYGEVVTVAKDEQVTKNVVYTIAKGTDGKFVWNTDNMSVVGFVYNEQTKEVYDVEEISLY
ncbi:hypothetical protein M2132_001591 [Dysgonomonas sp. PH5-45]|uniref:Omp28 family outer membrane lipoprotein n=1 Tax=unclassified Dysgonomonas TaxID=2630389 RepID=UPI0024767468|nr:MULTISPECIES: Omp28 family outer membrane lipoprotein [unclassified Dysgonomonas]MDH6355253.1 hypothetical protein [Dysgonomonas sp. PH5-45]MDH6388125.1 hypothetical protein [Dysgonomonas sp. PH5-37]